jgi:hypothetical protein
MKRAYKHGKPEKSKFHNNAGNLTPYAFHCGHVEEYTEDENRLTISQEPNDYHVKGFINEKHVWKIFQTLREARKFCRRPHLAPAAH